MRLLMSFIAAACLAASTSAAVVSVDYTVDAGGKPNHGLDGLSARATFSTNGNELSILLQNTSTARAPGFSRTDMLLTSIAFNLPGLSMQGVAARLALGDGPISEWVEDRTAGLIGQQWKWTNDGGRGLLSPYSQVITTVNSSVGQTSQRFTGDHHGVGGALGGIASMGLLPSFPALQQLTSVDSISFTLTLNGALTTDQLAATALGAMVEFGAHRQYLRAQPAPAPGAALLGILGLGALSRRLRAA